MKMKKLAAAAVMLAALALPAFAGGGDTPISGLTSICASALEYGDYSYTVLSDGTVEITDYNSSTKTAVTIPSTINGKKVTSIGNRAFEDSNIVSVKFPDTLKTIDNYAFYGCYNLTGTVTLPKNIESVGYCAFEYLNINKMIVLNDNLEIGSFAISANVIRCSSKSTAYQYAKEERISVELTDGKSLSKAVVTLSKKRAIYGDYELPDVTVKYNGVALKEDVHYTVDYANDVNIGTAQVKISAVEFNPGFYTGTTTATYQIVPEKPTFFRASESTTASQAGMKWEAVDGATGYQIFRYNSSTKKYEKIKAIKSRTTTSYVDTGRAAQKTYLYKIRSYTYKGGKYYFSDYSDPIKVYTLPSSSSIKTVNDAIAAGKTATLSGKNFTTKTYAYDLCDFFDYKNNYTVAYSDDNNVYIKRFDSNLNVTKTLTIKKKYPLFGKVIGDSDGNYYIAWGKTDESGKGNVVTFAVSKYNYNGEYIKTCTFKATDGYWDTRTPFWFGGCDMTIQNGVLVCTYAKHMYNGHQANAVFNVNIKNMTENDDYSAYTSHSFAQRVISLKNGGVIFADLGDAYPRGFHLTANSEQISWGERVPFHFYGELGANFTNSELAGIGEVSTGCVLVGTSGKEMTKAGFSAPRQLFVQIIDPITGKSIIDGSTRKGTSCGESTTDTGIKWITNYTDGSSAESPAMAIIGNDKIFVAWEKYNKNGAFVNSYYAIVSSTGKIIQNPTPMRKVRLNGSDELKYYNGCVYWTVVKNDNTARVYKVRPGVLSKRVIADASVSISSSSYVYTGKTISPAVTVKYGSTTLTKGIDYTVSYQNNKNIGKAKIVITGKGKYAGAKAKYFYITPGKVKNVNQTYITGGVKCTWSKVSYATGYQIEKTVSDGWWSSYLKYGYVKTPYYSDAKHTGSEYYRYRFRAYKTVNGEKIYGAWSDYTDWSY